MYGLLRHLGVSSGGEIWFVVCMEKSKRKISDDILDSCFIEGIFEWRIFTFGRKFENTILLRSRIKISINTDISIIEF